MKVQIKSWKDLKPRDGWLGITVSLDSLPGKCPGVTFDETWMNAAQVQTIIEAGNNWVERKPEKVERYIVPDADIGLEYDCGHSIGASLKIYGLPEDLRGRAKVTIEPI